MVEREVEERRTSRRRHRDADRLVHQSLDLARRIGGRGEFDQRADKRDVIDLLQRSLAPAPRRSTAAEHEQRRAIVERGRERAHPIGDPRTRGQRADADLSGDLRPPLRGERRGLLVADVDDLDPLGAAAVVDREQVPAGQREQLRDPVRAQSPRDQPAPMELAVVLHARLAATHLVGLPLARQANTSGRSGGASGGRQRESLHDPLEHRRASDGVNPLEPAFPDPDRRGADAA